MKKFGILLVILFMLGMIDVNAGPRGSAYMRVIVDAPSDCPVSGTVQGYIWYNYRNDAVPQNYTGPREYRLSLYYFYHGTPYASLTTGERKLGMYPTGYYIYCTDTQTGNLVQNQTPGLVYLNLERITRELPEPPVGDDGRIGID